MSSPIFRTPAELKALVDKIAQLTFEEAIKLSDRGSDRTWDTVEKEPWRDHARNIIVIVLKRDA